MKKQKGLGLIGVLLIISALFLTAGGMVVWQKKTSLVLLPSSPPLNTSAPTTTNTQIQKTTDECEINTDCQYIWFTGGCHTPEYVKTMLEKAEKEGIRLGEAPYKEGIACECQNSVCVEKEEVIYKEDVGQFCGLEGLKKLSLREFPVTWIDKCGPLYRLFRECCDAPDIILDENFNFVAACGGLATYSDECTRIVSPYFNKCVRVVTCGH